VDERSREHQGLAVRAPSPGDPALEASSSATRPFAKAHRPDGTGIDVIDFFCGCGGTSAGLRAAGMNILAGIDLDREAAETYRANFATAKFIERDIRKIEPTELDALVRRTPNSRLLFSACAPCQPYTNFHRKSERRAQQRTLLLQLLPFIDHLEPDFVFVENVPGLHKIPKGSTFNRFRAGLARRGYFVAWAIVDCRDYGVPQRRRRLTLLASRLGPIEVPPATHGSQPGLSPWSTVREWISHFPSLEDGDVHPTVPNHQTAKLTDLNLRRIRATPQGGGRRDWPAELWLKCHAEHRGHSDVYGRMHWDAAAPVLTTKCTSISNGRYGHPEQDRPISVREAASLQTFPEDFVFEGRIKSTTRQVGNAVPVLLAEAMGHAICAHVALDHSANRSTPS
jgi:DNA (cytosine-5)-methyltransferase 1